MQQTELTSIRPGKINCYILLWNILEKCNEEIELHAAVDEMQYLH